MSLERNYAQATYDLIAGGMPVKRAVEQLEALLRSRGHAKLARRIMRALLRIAEQEEQYDTAVLTLRGPKEEKKLGAAIEDAVRELGAKDAAREVRQNPHLVGGFMLSYRGIEIDSSYKSKLLELYRRVTAG